MNKDIRKAVEDKLAAAEDNLYRATAAFRGLSPALMASEYGESGETRAQIIAGYQKEVERWKKALGAAT